MTRHFIFTDETSNKFWQIDTQDTSFSVSFGKVGTAGQSQTKTFDTAERCQREADKLIREKTGKGYVESVNGIAVALSPAPAAPPAVADNQQELEVVLRYEEIIRNTRTDQLLPFLQSVDKRHYLALEVKAKKIARELVELGQINTTNWAIAQKKQDEKVQLALIHLSELALSNKGEIWIKTALSDLFAYTNYNVLLPILTAKRPEWLAEHLLKDTWNRISYQKIRRLEYQGILNYNPELFVSSIVKFNRYSRHPDDDRKCVMDYINFLLTDEIACTRDIPALFDYPIRIHNVNPSLTDENLNSETIYIWPQIFSRLLAEGKIDRLWFLEKCLSVQTKDWKADLRSFYRTQIETANPTIAEWLALQPVLFPLLAAQHPHVVNWTVGTLKTMYSEPGFRANELLEWASTMMMRNDCKTSLKTLLGMFERLLKTQPALRPAIAQLLTDVFALNDLPLQTKAAQLLANYADSTDLDLQNRLQTYTGQMLGHVANDLKAFLVDNETTEPAEANAPVSYQYAPLAPVQRLVPGQEVHLPATWNDFVFLIGKFIGSNDPLDGEILMNALILTPADMPDNYREQLKVYEKQLEKVYFSVDTKKQCLSHYLLYWLADSQDETKLQYTLNQVVTGNRRDMGGVIDKQIKYLHQKRKDHSGLSLLSLPTHAPHWVAPKILVQKLLNYQQADEVIDPLGLAIAIARMPREDMTEAIQLSAELEGNLAQLMHYCLGVTTDIKIPRHNAIKKVLSIFRNDDALTHLQALWAVAARTFDPDGEFSEFADTSIADMPNVAKPFIKDVVRKDQWSEWINPDTNQQERNPLWRELIIPFPEKTLFANSLLYSNDLFDNRGGNWQLANLSQNDILCWYSLIPQQPESLFTVIVKYGCFATDESPTASHALRLMFQPNFQFREMSLLVLACGLLAQKRETGALAAEVLIHHFGQQTLDVARLGDRLGWLLSGNYAPVQRLTDGLNLVKDVSLLHNKALLLTLDALFAPFAPMASLPKNTRKLLEIYLDLLVKLHQTPAIATSALLVKWQEIGSLKKLCQDIIKQA